MDEPDNAQAQALSYYKELVEQRFRHERELSDEKIMARDKANELACSTLSKHVSDLDRLKISLFTRTDHEIFARQINSDIEKSHEQMQEKVEEVRDALNESTKPKWQIWVPMFGLFVTLLLSAVSVAWYVTGLAQKPLELQLSHFDEKYNINYERIKALDAHMIAADENLEKRFLERDKMRAAEVFTLTDRINRLYDLYRDLNIGRTNEPEQEKKATPRR